MPTFSKAGRKIFLAELTALSVISVIKINQKVSGAFDVRHKIAENVLNDIYFACVASEENTYYRLLSICKLIVFSSAAYSELDIKSLVSNKANEIAYIDVHPHFGGVKRFALAYANEPMNFWFGMATENRELNQMAVDPHMTKIDSYKGVKYKVSQPSNQPASSISASRNQVFSQASSLTTSIELTGPHALSPIKNFASKTSQPQSTPVSKGLQENEDALDWEFNSFVGLDGRIIGPKEIVEDFGTAKMAVIRQLNRKLESHYDDLLESLRKMSKFVLDMNAAGKEHYVEILSQMDLRGIDKDDDFYEVIDSAKNNWVINRESLREIVASSIVELESRSHTLKVEGKKVIVPKNFFLNPIKL
jgi:hypothetical protein